MITNNLVGKTEISSRAYDYWLCSIPGVGNRSIERLLELCGSAREIFEASEEVLKQVLPASKLTELVNLRACWDLQAEYNKLKEQGIEFVTIEDAVYPKRLRQIPDAPYGIFYKGILPDDDNLSVAIIGARDCSEYGRYVAEELGRYLGQHGIQVISGMARGIDGISQQAAFAAGGNTTAVLGCGVDICYPVQNKSLYEAIPERGCILSSYPPGTQPRPQNFPPRNRIVSGLADVVVVIEARNKSGTLITVDMALEQGKEVYVVPGRITDRLSDGCNRLLKQGAGVLTSPADFLEEIQKMWLEQRGIVPEEYAVEGEDLKERVTVLAGKDAKKEDRSEPANVLKLPISLQPLYQQLDLTPKSVEKILEELWEKGEKDWTISGIAAGLMRLCMMGEAVQNSTGHFSRKHP